MCFNKNYVTCGTSAVTVSDAVNNHPALLTVGWVTTWLVALSMPTQICHYLRE